MFEMEGNESYGQVSSYNQQTLKKFTITLIKHNKTILAKAKYYYSYTLLKVGIQGGRKLCMGDDLYLIIGNSKWN